ncbi:hypothetical protein ACHQM5_021816 [Ranunculus cassubicifolius]
MDFNKNDLEKHTCDCRKWDISGIPCVHAVASIAPFSVARSINWASYCSPLLTVKKYHEAYSSWIKPPLHEDCWDLIPSDVLPPMLHRRPGRPRTKRRRGDGEGPIPATDNQRRCSTCGGYNHNKASCQGGPTKAQRSGENAAARGDIPRGGRSTNARGGGSLGDGRSTSARGRTTTRGGRSTNAIGGGALGAERLTSAGGRTTTRGGRDTNVTTSTAQASSTFQTSQILRGHPIISSQPSQSNAPFILIIMTNNAR